jgi:hypothetical protein
VHLLKHLPVEADPPALAEMVRHAHQGRDRHTDRGGAQPGPAIISAPSIWPLSAPSGV